MISLSADTATLRVIIAVLVLVQVILDVVALRALFTTSPDRLRYLGRWPWAAVILLVSTFGAIAFLAVGRSPAPVAEPIWPDRRQGPHEAIDVLYGEHKTGTKPNGTQP